MKLLLQSFLQALSMYSILPVPGLKWESRADRHMLALYPAVGLVIGALWYGAARLFSLCSLPRLPAGAMLTALPFLLTGFLHLDGFMDVSDAVLSRRDRERRLEILKDSHTGAFAVISVALLILVQFSAVATIGEQPDKFLIFLLLPVMSRGWAGFGLLRLPLLPGSSMGAWVRQDTGRVHQVILILWAVLAGAALFLLCGWPGLAAAIAGTLGYWLCCGYGISQLGGVSGDVTGYALSFGEGAALLAACLL